MASVCDMYPYQHTDGNVTMLKRIYQDAYRRQLRMRSMAASDAALQKLFPVMAVCSVASQCDHLVEQKGSVIWRNDLSSAPQNLPPTPHDLPLNPYTCPQPHTTRLNLQTHPHPRTICPSLTTPTSTSYNPHLNHI
jgi:hypothetical protein